MFNLLTSEKYNKELADFKSKASKIKIPETKKQVDQLLRDLEEQVKIINDAHAATRGLPIDPKSVHENIEQTSKIRWKLKSLLRV